MADLIEREFPDRSIPIADVAAGKGHLKSELYRRGYHNVTCWDRRHRFAKGRPGQKYRLFDFRQAPQGYRLVVAMHPDEATDHAILYAAKHRKPFVVCPCCIKPSAVPVSIKTKPAWLEHLRKLAREHRMTLREFDLHMAGDRHVLVGRPSV